MATLPHSSLFNADWYLTQYPDVAEAVRQGLITAEEHFAQFGNAEGRAAGPLFNPEDYLAANPDVAAAVAAGLMSASCRPTTTSCSSAPGKGVRH